MPLNSSDTCSKSQTISYCFWGRKAALCLISLLHQANVANCFLIQFFQSILYLGHLQPHTATSTSSGELPNLLSACLIYLHKVIDTRGETWAPFSAIQNCSFTGCFILDLCLSITRETSLNALVFILGTLNTSKHKLFLLLCQHSL